MGLKEDMSRQLERFGRKTSAILEEARLRGRINVLENEIKNLYVSVGMTMFSMWKQQNVDTGRLVKYFEAISRKQEEIEEKKEMILQAKARGAGEEETGEKTQEKPGRPLLPDYGGRMAGIAREDGQTAETAADQPKAALETAGAEKSDAETVVPADGVVIEEEDNGAVLPGDAAVFVQEHKEGPVYCPRCGTECPADANFCRKCGMRLG